MKENKLLLKTPQNVELEYDLARVGERLGAYALDYLFMVAYFILFLVLQGYVEFFQNTSVAFIFNLPLIFYRPVCEVILKGQTIGKRQLKLRVMRVDGGNCNIFHYMLRFILEPVDLLFLGGPGLIAVSASKYNQRLADLAAGTTVVKENNAVSVDGFLSKPLEVKGNIDYPQAVNLSPEQVQLLEDVIQTHKNNFDMKLVEECALAFENHLRINKTVPPLKFLFQLLHSYRKLSYQELEPLDLAS